MMKELPDSKIYEQEFIYMPYRDSVAKVLELITERLPKNAKLLDMMCGPGYILGKVRESRPDLSLSGVDIDERYISYSKDEYPEIEFEVGDVLTWKAKELYDVVICTGSVHHVPYDQQDEAIRRMAEMTKPGGLVIISDCHIGDYKDEMSRKIAAAKMDYGYLVETISNGAPEEVVEATIDILHNDIMMNEYKSSVKKRMPIFNKYFSETEVFKTWPKEESEYGDYIMVCKR